MIERALLLLALTALSGVTSALSPPTAPAGGGRIVVANRADGTLSILDTRTDAVVDTIVMPSGPTPEPMYVWHTAGRVFVGDRAGHCVVAFRAADMQFLGAVPTAQGVFHMSADLAGRQLWVVGDTENALSVVDPRALTEITRIPLPADLVALGGKPHDVAVGEHFAYVSMVDVGSTVDVVVQYSKHTFAEVGRVRVGDDPHVALPRRGDSLYVASQGAGMVFALDARSLAYRGEIPVPGAHGTSSNFDGPIFYTTNLPGGGADGLVAIDTRTMRVLGAADTPFSTPHNIAATERARKIYVTHSGATADRVSIYETSARNPVPRYLGEVTVGLNPFGLAFVPE